MMSRVLFPLEWDVLEVVEDGNLVFCAVEESCEKYIGLDDRLEAMLSASAPVATYGTLKKWGVVTRTGYVVIEPKLDQKPKYIKPEELAANKEPLIKYYLIEKKPGYGVVCSDGRLISDTVLYKKDAIFIIEGRYSS